MAEFFGATTSDGRSESSMVDSITMPILHSAMNRALAKFQSRDGVLQCLADQSKFCNLALMQLDACVSFLQSANETTAYRNLVADLTEIRDRLLGRLIETERAITDKDKELQRLRSRKEDEKEQLQDCDLIGSEIYRCKETIDVAMIVIQNAISVSEVRPCELRFCCEMEKEIMKILFAGYVRDFQLRTEEKSVKSGENWRSLGDPSGLMDDLSSFRCELESFAGSMSTGESKNRLIKIQEKGSKEGAMDEGVNKVSMIIKAHETIIQKKSDKLDVKIDVMKESSGKRCKETDELLMSVQRLIQRLDSCADKNLNHEKEIFTQESNLRVEITEEIQRILLRCMMKDFQQHMHDHDFRKLIANASIENTNMRGKKYSSKELNLQGVVTGETQGILLRCVMKDFQKQMHDHELMNSIRHAVHMDFFRETMKYELIKVNEKIADHWKHNLDMYRIDALIREEIFEHVFMEELKCIASKVSELAQQNKELRTICNSLVASEELKDTYESYNIFTKEKSTSEIDTKGSRTFIQRLDSFLCHSEEENSLLPPSSDDENEHNAEFIIQDSEHEALMMVEENNREMNFNSACDKFRKALMQLGTSKMILRDLGSDQAADFSDGDDKRGPCNQKQALTMQVREATKRPKSNHLAGFGFSVGEFSQVITNLENVLNQKLDVNFVRLARLKNQLLQSVGLAASLRRKESLYKQAFMIRCENLQKAENEVDILGDQVNALFRLLERIYKTIQYHAPALLQCSGVLNILTLIKKELNQVMA